MASTVLYRRKTAGRKGSQPGHRRVAAALSRHGKRVVRAALNHRGERREITRSYLFDALRRVTPSIAVQNGDTWFYVLTSDQVGEHTFVHGDFELDVMARALALVEERLGADSLRGRTFVDIGANIGTSTVSALKSFGFGRAVAFEPEPRNFRLLRCNAIVNEVDDRTEAVCVAVSDTSGVGRLEIAQANLGDHRVRLREATDGRFGEPTRATMEVRLATFDELAAELGLDIGDIGLVWMDTQGHEAHVLAGATSLVESAVPIVTEYWPYGLRRADALERFHQLVAKHYGEVIDVRKSTETGTTAKFPAARVAGLERDYDEGFTDLILLK